MPDSSHSLVRFRESIAHHVKLTDPEFDLLCSHLQPRRVRKRGRLLVPGEVCRLQGYVDAGCLRIYYADRDGGEHVLSFAPSGTWFTDVQSFVLEKPAVLGIDALEDSEVLLIDRAARERLCASGAAFERLFRLISEHTLITLQQRVIASLHQTAADRYLDFRRQYPGLEERIPQHQVASYLGISPEFLCRIRKRPPRSRPR